MFILLNTMAAAHCICLALVFGCHAGTCTWYETDCYNKVSDCTIGVYRSVQVCKLDTQSLAFVNRIQLGWRTRSLLQLSVHSIINTYYTVK